MEWIPHLRHEASSSYSAPHLPRVSSSSTTIPLIPRGILYIKHLTSRGFLSSSSTTVSLIMAHPTRNPTASEFNPPNDLPQQDVADLDLWSEGAHRPGVQPLLADTAYPPTYRQSEDGARLTSTQISDGVTVTVACPAPHVDYAPFAGAGSTLSTSPIVDSSFAVDPFVRDSQTIDPRLAFPYPSALATHSTPPVVPFLTQVNHSNSNAYNYHAGGQFVSQSFQASPQAGFDTPFPLPVAGPIDTHDLQAPSIGLVGGSLSGPRIDFPQVYVFSLLLSLRLSS
ncbi:hypothetical protein BDW22DRAFT_774974 [Trametopsis cervina]|nr:hypothetical protein BDW22DRAFT_774974 [Trametopsis cervina]